MADNGLLGLSLTVIAQEALPVLQKRLAPLGLFTTDFSGDVATVGSAVATRIPVAMTAADYTRAGGYGIIATSSSLVTVTLNKHKHYTMGFDDSEIGNIGLAKLQQTFIEPAVNSIVNAVQADVLALITTAFPATYSASYASFGFTGLVNAQKVLDTSGSTAPRGAILGTNLYYDLLDDIKGLYSVGAEALRAGQVGTIANVAVANVPATELAGLSGTPSGLGGFLCGKDALCIAARLPGVPTGNVQVANVTDPMSGFTVQLRQWYSLDDGMWKISAVAIYGCSRGNTSSGVRINTID